MQSLDNSSQAEPIENFDQLSLKNELLQGISNYGFKRPTELQAKGITSILQFHDTIIHLQAGAGKSVLYAIAALQMIDPLNPQLQALILAPTRELVFQNYELLSKLGKSMNISIASCVSKSGPDEDSQEINAQIIIGTIGGIKKMKNKGLVQLGKVRLLILDETDDMFSRDLEFDLRDLTRLLADETQIVVTTSTAPEGVRKYAEKFMSDPVIIAKKQLEYVNTNVDHFRVDVEKEEWKFDTICDILEEIDLKNIGNKCLVCCNSRTKAEKLVNRLEEKSWKPMFLDTELSHDEKQHIYNEFTVGNIKLLIVSEELANNLIPEVLEFCSEFLGNEEKTPFMVNYDMPTSPQKYASRANRCHENKTSKNLLVNFIANEDKNDLKKMEQHLNIELLDLPLNVEFLRD